MDIVRFDAGSNRFPGSRASALPTLALRSIQLKSRAGSSGQNRHAHLRWYSRSRYALTDALRACGIGPEAAVLIPAYHCRTMVDPGLRLNAAVHLYALRRDLSADIAALEAQITNCQPRPAALLAVHFFGIQQDLSRLQSICQRYGITLIEDCSHCLWHDFRSDNLGSTGQFSIWSPYKFYPCEDGGVLQANHGAQLPGSPQTNPRWLDEAKGVYRLLQRSRKQIRAAGEFSLPPEHAELLEAGPVAGEDLSEWAPAPSDQYVTAYESLQTLTVSRWIIQNANIDRIRTLRRERYLRWATLAASLSGCRPLHSALPTNCVPYMFPLQVDRPEMPFMMLKRLGFPVWRWDNMAASSCQVAQDYRLQVFQLPCHQELSEAEFSWMLQAVSAVLHRPASSAQGST